MKNAPDKGRGSQGKFSIFLYETCHDHLLELSHQDGSIDVSLNAFMEKYGKTNSETRIVSELVFPYFSIKAFFLTWRTGLGIYLYEEYEQISQNIII